MTRRHRAAVLGRPIAHSLSPVLHRAAYRALGLDWTYDAVDCGVEELSAVLDRLGADHAGVSLTMPLKLAAVPLVDELDPTAASVGAVNTVLFANAGRRGANTDVAGVAAGLRELGAGAAAPAVVLGAGGTARAALAALAGLGHRTVTVVGRDPARVEGLRGVGELVGVEVVVREWPDISDVVSGAGVVVATTPAGATDGLAAAGWPGRAALLEVVYDPWPTPLARAAAAVGAAVVGGLSVLVGQAAEQVRLMTGTAAPVAAMRAAGEAALAARG